MGRHSGRLCADPPAHDLGDLETLRLPWSQGDIERIINHHLWAWDRCGLTISEAHLHRIEAARVHANRVGAECSLEQLRDFKAGPDHSICSINYLNYVANQIRAQFIAGGVGVTASGELLEGIDSKINAAKGHANRISALYFLKEFEKPKREYDIDSVNRSAENIRAQFIAGGVGSAVSGELPKSLESRINAVVKRATEKHGWGYSLAKRAGLAF